VFLSGGSCQRVNGLKVPKSTSRLVYYFSRKKIKKSELANGNE
jgi:hypothetical protein